MRLRKYKKHYDYFFYEGERTNDNTIALFKEALKKLVKTGKHIKVTIYEEDTDGQSTDS